MPQTRHRLPILVVLAALTAWPSGTLAQDASAIPTGPPATAAPASPAASASAGEAVPMPTDGGPLAAGRYVDDSLGREIAFDVGEGWIADTVIPDVGIAMVQDGPGEPYVAFTRFYGDVYPEGCATGEDDAAFYAEAVSVDVTAAAFVAHLAGHPALTTGEPQSTEVAGLPALQLDVSAVDVADECAPPWAWLWHLPEVGDYHLSEGQQARVLAVDAGPDEVIVLVFESLPDIDAASWGATVDAILASLTIGPAAG